AVAGAGMRTAPLAGRATCYVPELPLMPGHYNVQYSCLLGSELADKVHQAGSLVVVAGDFYGTGRLPPQAGWGPILVRNDFSLEPIEDAVPTRAAASEETRARRRPRPPGNHAGQLFDRSGCNPLSTRSMIRLTTVGGRNSRSNVRRPSSAIARRRSLSRSASATSSAISSPLPPTSAFL